MESYTKVDNEVIHNNSLKPVQKIVLIVLLSYYNEKEECSFPSHSRLMEECCIKDKKTLLKTLDFLEDQGYIKRKSGKGVNTKYYFSSMENSTRVKNSTKVMEKIPQSSGKNPPTAITNTNTKAATNIYNDLINAYTQNDNLAEAINDFIKMRKQIKKPLTERALKNVLSKLGKIGSDDLEKIEILDNSINNCWQGIFELKNKKATTAIDGSKNKSYNQSICQNKENNSYRDKFKGEFL